MASQKELRALITLAGKIDPSLQNALMKASKQTNTLSQSAKKTSSSITKVGSIAKGVFAGVLGASIVQKVGGALIETGKNGIQLASDLTEVQNVVDTTFGSGAKQINSWAQTALKSFGLSELQAKQFNGTMGAMLKSTGLSSDSVVKMSEKLTGLSGDMASFYNISQEDAFQKIQAGIAGETKPLKELGINMDVANLQAYALSKGIKTSYAKMDQATQTALRYSYIMDKTKDAQGDFSKTSGTFANQTRLLKTNFEQFSAKIGSLFLPILSKGMQLVNKFMDTLSNNPAILNGIQKALSGLFNNIDSVLPTIMNLVLQLLPVISSIFDVKSPILPAILDVIKGLLPVILSAVKQLLPVISQLINGVLPLLTPLLKAIVAVITPLIPVVVNLIKSLLPPLMQIIQAIVPLVQSLIPIIQFLGKVIGLYLATCIAEIMPWINAIATNFKNFVAILTSVINFIVDVFSGNWKKAWQDLGNIVTGIFKYVGDGIKGFLNGIIGSLNGAIGGINTIIGAIGKKIGINIQIPTIPTFARGGIANQASIFGEAGPEMAIPLKRTPRSLGLLNQTAELLGAKSKSSNNQPVQITYAPVYYGGNKEEVSSEFERHKEEIKELIEDILDNGGRPSFG